MRALVAVALASLLLAGCSDGGDSGDLASAEPVPDAADAGPLNLTQASLSFAAAEGEQALAQDLTIAPGETCLFFPEEAVCSSRRLVDLTPIIPVEVPVQLGVAVDDDAQPGAFVDWSLDIQQGSITSFETEADDGEGETVLVLVLQPGGTVQLVIQQYLAGMPPQATNVHVQARTVVRPDIVPAYLPVAVALRAGDLVKASGDVDDLVVVAPDGAVTHDLLQPFEVNATAAGTYVLFVQGAGDIRLYGPNGTAPLRALLIQEATGEQHPAQSGQEVTWEFTVPGIPLYVGVLVATADNTGMGFGAGGVHGNYDLSIARAGATILQASETDCTLLVNCGFALVGNSNAWYYGDYLDEKLGPGTYQGTARFETANGMTVTELYGYIDL